MKKTLKSIIAATLALVMLLCSVPAFAAEADETVKWYWREDNYLEYHYEGDLEEGTVEFPDDIPDHIYYTFEAKEEGYYFLGAENGWLAFFTPEEIRADGFYGEEYADEHIGKIAETEDFASLYYLKKGEHIIGVTFGEGTASPSSLAECGGFSFEYCGKEVTDLSFEESSLEDLVINLDVVFDEHSSAENGVPYGAFIYNVTVTFSSGKSIVINNSYAITAQKSIEEGSNDVEIEFLGYKENIEIEVCSVSHFVKSVELSNVEKHMNVKEYYDGSCEYYGDAFIGETVTVTFTDGTKKTCEIDPFGFSKIEFPNGRKYSLDVSRYERVNNETTFVDICITLNYRCEIGRYECNVEQATIKENSEALKNNIEHGTYWKISNIRYAFYDIFEFDSPFELINNINEFISVFIVNSTAILECVNSELDLFIEWAE